MAVKNQKDPFRISPEMKQRLTDVQGDIDRSKRAIEVLKSLGMDTKVMEEKIAWSEQVRTVLLKEFSG